MQLPEDPFRDELEAARRLQAEGRLDAAMLRYKSIIEGDPTAVEAMHGLAVCLLEREQPEPAVKLLGHALAFRPNWALGRTHYALALLRAGRAREALEEARVVLLDQPAFAEALRVGGAAAKALDEPEEAIRFLARYHEQHPEDTQNAMRLASARLEQGEKEAARALYERILAFEPDHAASRAALSELLRSDDPDRSAALLREARALAPEDFRIAFVAASRSRVELDWRDDEALRATLAAGLEEHLAGKGPNPFSLAQLLSLDLPIGLLRRVVRKRAGELWEGAAAHRERYRAPSVPRAPGERLRIGYFTCNLRQHPMAHVLRTALPAHDRQRYEIHFYSAGPRDDLPWRSDFAAAVEHFVDLYPARVVEAAERIRRDRIHVLVDLDMHESNGTPLLACLRPAPLVVAGLGFPDSWGSGEAVDYTLVDPIVVPEAERGTFAEAVVQLPTCYLPFDAVASTALETGARRASRAGAGLPEKATVLASFCSSTKLNPPTLDDWCEILRAVPDTVLWVLVDGERPRANFRRECEQRGVDGRRVVFADGVRAWPDHLARIRLADLVLDNLVYGAHSTAMDALLAGVPILTATGDAMRGRVATSILHHAGLDELACADRAAFVSRGIELARNRAALGALRQRVPGALERAGLLDPRSWTGAVERSFEHMWERHAAGLPPESFPVASG